MSPFLTLSNPPNADTCRAIKELDVQLRPLGHLTISPIEGQVPHTKKIAEMIRSRLLIPGERTVVLLDSGGNADSNSISAALAAHGPTTFLSVAQDEYMLCSGTVTNHIAIRGGTTALLSHVSGSAYLSRTADLVVGYHGGGIERTANLRLAAHMLTDVGLYVEIFAAPEVRGEVTTLYGSKEARDIAKSIASEWQRFAWDDLKKV